MILRGLVIRPLLREKLRSTLTVFGIAVGVAVIVAIQLANQSALRAFRESVDAVAGRANYQIAPDVAPLDERTLLPLRDLWDDGVRFAPVIDIEGVHEPAGTPIRILAVDLLSDIHFRDYQYAEITTGVQADAGAAERYLQLLHGDSVILPEPYARERGLRLGSVIRLNVRGQKRDLHVRGILEAKGPATAFNGSIAVCDIAVAQRLFGLIGKLSRIDVLVPSAAEEHVVEAIRRRLPNGVRLERPSRRNERVERMLRAFRVNLFALAGVALLVGMFLVYNTVLIAILRRRSEIGILKTLGVAARQILGAFLLEGALFGLLGSVVGIGLGLALATMLLGLIGRTVNSLYVASAPSDVLLTPGTILGALAVGVALATLSAIQPAIEASQIPPSTLIREGLQQRVRPGRILRMTAIGLAVFVVAAAVSRIPPVGGIAVAGYASVLLVVIGFALLTPLLLTAAAKILRPPFRRLFGVPGDLAAVTLPSSLRRASIATSALATAIGMMVAVGLMVGSFRETVRIWVDQTVSSDLWLRPSKGLSNATSALFPAEIADAVKGVPFVRAVDRVRGKDVVYADTIIAVGSSDFQVAAANGRLPMVTPRSPAKALRAAIQQNGVLVSESFALKYEKNVGDAVMLPTVRGQTTFPITGIYRDYSNDRGVVVMDRELFIRAFDDRLINTLVVYLRPGTSRDDARRELEKRFSARYSAFVVLNEEIRREVMNIFDQTFLITYALLAIAIVVAVLGVINTLSALIIERRRELALLRVGGMSPAQLQTMVLLESSILGIVSIVAGSIMGYILSTILIYVINKQSFGWTIEFHAPLRLLIASLAVTFLASVLAGLVPSRLARRINLAAAIKSE